MKKKIISFAAIIALLFGSMFMTQSKAQIFIMEDESSRLRANESELPIIPWLGATHDQYAPLGGEVLVLGLLGGAYLLFKGKKKNHRPT